MALSHLADTSAIVGRQLLDLPDGSRVATSVVCIGELEAAVFLARTDELRRVRLRRLLATIEATVVLDVDRDVAAAYAELRAATGCRPSNDLWIAATAKAHGLVLVTRDRRLAALPGVASLLV